MRISKANKGAVVVRAVRRHPSPQPASLESLEAAWSERGLAEVKPPESSPSHEGRNGEPGGAGNGMEGHEGGGGGGPPRVRKKGFRPPDVRTIFSPGERDPRVEEESGEGHTFEAGGEDTWCDLCCYYIFQDGVTCAGCKYTCHAACRDRVSLDCHPAASPVSQDQINNNTPPH
ncbi:ras association domain-containing protein 5-like [Cottoperca gobio]|uniref:Ras association domain-containing protein 5-like n=1 Tax=Cottoperca gobio TaxID=56716 RepID=A0A6J2S5C3_COTGO|nr:ras association domain-containing protein 5-like [Cottoperca gobio]